MLERLRIRRAGWLVVLAVLLFGLVGISQPAMATVAPGSATWSWQPTTYTPPTFSFVTLQLNVSSIVPRGDTTNPSVCYTISGTGVTTLGGQTGGPFALQATGSSTQLTLATTLTPGTAIVTLQNGVCSATGDTAFVPGGASAIIVVSGSGASGVTGITPSSGPTTGATYLTLTGTSLSGTTSVTIDGVFCTPVVAGSTYVTCYTGPHAASGTYTVYANGVATSVVFTYGVGATGVTGVTPSSGPTTGGTVIQLTGTNLGSMSTVTIDGVSCSGVAPSYSIVTCTTGYHPASGTYAIYVNGVATGVTFTYGVGFTGVTGVTPSTGPTTGGTLIQLSGTNLAGVATVVIDGVSCTGVSPSYFTVTCTTGYHGTTGSYTIYVNGSATSVTFTYGSGLLPAVYSVTPSSGPASGTPITYVTISGANFTGVQSVTFGGTAALSYTVQDVNTIQATAPSHSAGTVDVVVTTLAGTSPNTVNDNFTFTGTGIPSVTSVSPSSGATGASVIVYGSGFTGALSVRFGGVASSFTVNSDTQITATVPAGIPTGTMDVIVTTSGGSSTNTSADNFTNTGAPATMTYSLYATWTLFVWNGASGTDIGTALSGSSTNTQLNSILSRVTEILWWNASIQAYKAWFPTGASNPGANDITTFTHGLIYWVAITPGSSISWTIAATSS